MLRSILFRSLSALLLTATLVQAADVYVVHAIDGRDLGFAGPELPVDIQIDGGPGLEAVPFGASAGPLAPLAGLVGDVRVTVRLSDDIADSYTGTVVIDKTVNLAAFETAALVAHLDSRGTISLSKFTVDNSALADGQTRVSVAHAAVAPAVDVRLRGVNGTRGGLRLRNVENGAATVAAEADAGTYRVSVRRALSKGGNLASFDDVGLDGNALVVAAGSVAGGTFTLIPVAIQPAP